MRRPRGSAGGKRNRHWKIEDGDLPQIPLKSIGDVSGLLEETINRVRQGPFDLRVANAIGFLAGILLKAIDSGRIEGDLAHLGAAMTEVGLATTRTAPENQARSTAPNLGN
jgi:hypothetical protein